MSGGNDRILEMTRNNKEASEEKYVAVNVKVNL